MTQKARQHVLILAAILGLAGQIPVVIHICSPYQNFPNVYIVIQNFSAFLFAPLFALVALVGARRVLRRPAKSPSTSLETTKMQVTARIGATGIAAWIVLVVFTLMLWGAPDSQTAKERIVNDLNNLAAQAFQYRIRPSSNDRGDGSYVGFQIPTRLRADTAEGFYYGLIIVSSDSIIFEGRNEKNKGDAVRVKIDSEGRLVDWQYFGRMAY